MVPFFLFLEDNTYSHEEIFFESNQLKLSGVDIRLYGDIVLQKQILDSELLLQQIPNNYSIFMH